MGANQFQNSNRGMTMQQAFNKAVENAEDEYGHQEGYSGQINCHSSYYDKTAEWKASKLSPNNFIDKAFAEDKLSKHDSPWGICIKEPVKNSNKIKTHVEHNVEPGAKKWVQMYRVHNYTTSKEFLLKGDAVKHARDLCEKTKERYHIDIVKVLQKGSTRTATVTYKPSPKESEGVYIFFGEANC